MPVYNGAYYYLNDINKVSEVVWWENRWWAKYALFEDTNLPHAIQQENYPETDYCPFSLTRDEFIAKLNDTPENLVVYVQDDSIKTKIISNTKSQIGANWTTVTLSNGATLYKQKINDKWGIVVIYDPNAKMYPRVPGIIILALIIAVAWIVVTALTVYNNYLTQSYTTQRQHEALEALRWYNRTTITDAQGNPVKDVWQFGNGSVYTYDYATGKFEQQQAGASGQSVLDTIPQGNVSSGGISSMWQTIGYAILGIVVLIIILAIVYMFVSRSRTTAMVKA
jgi:hypothetical protein